MAKLLYDISVYLYGLAIRLASLFNSKAALWVKGRKDIFAHLAQVDRSKKIIWFHCASLGEFEQGRPLIEMVKTNYPELTVILTFFSPSGFEIRKEYKGAHHVFYLPLDTPGNAKRFIEFTNPVIAVFVKYEFWYNYLLRLEQKNIPVVLVSAIFRPGQYFFKWYGKKFLDVLKGFETIFVQDKSSLQLLQDHGVKNVEFAGDTRFDRVAEIAEQKIEIPEVLEFKGKSRIIIAGSTWPEDDKLLIEYMNSSGISHNIKYIIVPHNINVREIEKLKESIIKNTVLFSAVGDKSLFDVMIVDKIGFLSALYRYADVAYVGGGFGTSVHNVLEPAVFGMPVLFGPNHHKSREALEMIKAGAAFSVNNFEELKDKLDFFMSDAYLVKIAAEVSKLYVSSNRGASKIILERLSRLIAS